MARRYPATPPNCWTSVDLIESRLRRPEGETPFFREEGGFPLWTPPFPKNPWIRFAGLDVSVSGLAEGEHPLDGEEELAVAVMFLQILVPCFRQFRVKALVEKAAPDIIDESLGVAAA
jgi:hypothetical protein